MINFALSLRIFTDKGLKAVHDKNFYNRGQQARNMASDPKCEIFPKWKTDLDVTLARVLTLGCTMKTFAMNLSSVLINEMYATVISF